MRLALASLMILAAPAALAQTRRASHGAGRSARLRAASTRHPGAAGGSGGLAPAPAAPEAPPAPPPPPAPPTDPAAIGVLAALDNVCVPLVDGGDVGKLAKANGFRKSNDAWVTKQKTYQITLQPQGSNPDQCHLDIISPVDPEAPAKPIVLALHDWAAVTRSWSLYRNDKTVQNNQEFTTRSWEHDEPGKHQALVLTTIRKPDGTPMKGANDTTQLIYSSTKTSS